jgi:hypothetical protein
LTGIGATRYKGNERNALKRHDSCMESAACIFHFYMIFEL